MSHTVSFSEMYKQLQYCRNCGKSKQQDNRITLLRCKACITELYCSRDCQKADWPRHKARCNVSKDSLEGMATIPGATEECQPLLKWATLHMFALQRLSGQELGIFDDPSRGAHVLFSVTVKSRPQETIKKRFFITDAYPHPFALTGPSAARARQAYELASANKQPGRGVYLIAILSEETQVPYVLHIEYDLDYRLPGRGNPKAIINIINNGLVL